MQALASGHRTTELPARFPCAACGNTIDNPPSQPYFTEVNGETMFNPHHEGARIAARKEAMQAKKDRVMLTLDILSRAAETTAALVAALPERKPSRRERILGFMRRLFGR